MRSIRLSRILSALQAAWRCQRGAAATEFAYLAPLLILMLLGTIEIGRAISMDRHFSLATSTASDLVAREESLGTSDANAQTNLKAMMDSIQLMMKPYDASTLKMGVFQVRASPDDATDTRVDWSYSFNGYTVPSQCDTYALPSGLVDAGASVIVVEFELRLPSAVRRFRARHHRRHDVDRYVDPQPAQQLRRLRRGRQLQLARLPLSAPRAPGTAIPSPSLRDSETLFPLTEYLRALCHHA